MYENNTALDPRRHREVRGRGRAEHRQVQEGLGRSQDQGRGRPGSKAGDRGRRQRHADLLHQRPRGGRRAAGRRVREGDRRRDQEGRRADQEGARRSRTSTRSGSRRRRWPRRPPAPSAPAAPEGKQNIKLGDAPVKGPASAKVTVVAFSDFQCPFCSRAVPVLKQIEDEYKGKVKIAFKQLPLPFHDKAHLAAEAALAANEQGKFWQMHDKLFANQQALDRPSLEKYAEELGPQHEQVQGGARLGQVQGQGRLRRQGGRRGRRHRHADLLHQRHEGRRRSAVRRVQDRHRHRAEEPRASREASPARASRSTTSVRAQRASSRAPRVGEPAQNRCVGTSGRGRRRIWPPMPQTSRISSVETLPW